MNILEGIDVVSVLKLGLPGLVFLLSVLSFRLLSEAQKNKGAQHEVLKTIRMYMIVNVALAILTAAAPVIEYALGPKSQTFNATAQTKETIKQGQAAVCNGTGYASRYLLVKDEGSGNLIQVFAQSVIPCGDQRLIAISPQDANNLGWRNGAATGLVNVIAALPGFMFVI